ncbi:MAG: alpha-amylase [Alloprevotella sp.]|nr:MAG: alpha-amylase [Alloprevotella sp.]
MNIYQIFTRLYGACQPANNLPNGTIADNGVAKFNEFTADTLQRIKDYGFTHVWFTGVLEHATQTDYTRYGIHLDHPWIVKGRAGSPYAIKDYFDVDPDLAEDVPNRMAEFEALLERTHKAGLKFVIDFVPNHVARSYHSDVAPKGFEDLGAGDDEELAFTPRNNFYYCWGEPLHTENFIEAEQGGVPYLEYPAKATGNDVFHAWPNRNDWYETVKLNYGVDYNGGGAQHFDPIPSTWQKMTDILLFWASKGVDAFRCDMAEMVPVAFWHYAIAQVKAKYDVQFIAEVYNPNEYRNYIHHGGFDYLYDKVGLYDTLRAVICQHTSAAAITNAWQNTDDIKEHMLYFLENHDEQRIASDFFCGDAQKAIPGLVVAACMGNNPLMIYAGQEIGEKGMDAEGFSGKDGRTTIFDYWSVPSLRKLSSISHSLKSKNSPNLVLTGKELSLYQDYQHILRLRNENQALSEGLFYDLMYVNYDGTEGFDCHRQYAFLRKTKDELLFCVANFSDNAIKCGVRIPAHAFDFLSIPSGEYSAIDLISGVESTIALFPEACTQIKVRANNAILLSVKF